MVFPLPISVISSLSLLFPSNLSSSMQIQHCSSAMPSQDINTCEVLNTLSGRLGLPVQTLDTAIYPYGAKHFDSEFESKISSRSSRLMSRRGEKSG
ncbi:hypothetical protein EV421DRAFT_1795971 [Armillaria borealis]|uniref:Uncharacterized protein n=1 Tax=Armillaria borealis TaxID=47425 RepID=A0AA39JQI1_9AGAR|nr:hypothetical protein EV421DRAFT_1795971 [Armillaria borealis]